MTDTWVLTLPCTRSAAESLSDDHAVFAVTGPAPVIVASEIDEEKDCWQIETYFEDKPPRNIIRAIGRALGIRPDRIPKVRALPPQDWVTLSQQGLEPVRAGRFHVHTGGDAPDDSPGIVNLHIDAGRAFGTGHHETTAGCLAALDGLAQRGQRYRNIADIGTGTGLLAFAALHLWPRASALASDIDPVSIAVSAENAAANGVTLGEGAGQLSLLVCDGTEHPQIIGWSPYDLVIANILAGPLITLAPALAAITSAGGTLILAGLIERQRVDVVRCYRRHGFVLIDNGGTAEWPVLRFRKRLRFGWRRPVRFSGGAGQPPGDFGHW